MGKGVAQLRDERVRFSLGSSFRSLQAERHVATELPQGQRRPAASLHKGDDINAIVAVAIEDFSTVAPQFAMCFASCSIGEAVLQFAFKSLVQKAIEEISAKGWTSEAISRPTLRL